MIRMRSANRYSLVLIFVLAITGLLYSGAARTEVRADCRIFGEADGDGELDWRDMEPHLYSYESILGKNVSGGSPNTCAKAAQSILGASLGDRKIVAVRFSYGDANLEYVGRRTSQRLELRMAVSGNRGMSGVIAHDIASQMGSLTGYICKVSPSPAEGLDRVTVKARY